MLTHLLVEVPSGIGAVASAKRQRIDAGKPRLVHVVQESVLTVDLALSDLDVPVVPGDPKMQECVGVQSAISILAIQIVSGRRLSDAGLGVIHTANEHLVVRYAKRVGKSDVRVIVRLDLEGITPSASFHRFPYVLIAEVVWSVTLQVDSCSG